MPGLGTKIKEALTPGHKNREANAMGGQTYANEGVNPNVSTNVYTDNRGINEPTGTTLGSGAVGGVEDVGMMGNRGANEEYGLNNTGVTQEVAITDVQTGGMAAEEGRMGGTEAGMGNMDRGVMGGTGGMGGVANTVAGDTVCNTRTFTEVEDRPVMRERVERIIEHRPVEKQFVVETRPVGEREVAEGVHFESAGVREYEVDRVEGTSCPTGTTGAGAVGNRDVL